MTSFWRTGNEEQGAVSAGGELPNLFADLPASLPEELVEVLAEGRHVRIERIVSTGQASPDGFWYDQDETEWVCVLRVRWTPKTGQPNKVESGPYGAGWGGPEDEQEASEVGGVAQGQGGVGGGSGG